MSKALSLSQVYAFRKLSLASHKEEQLLLYSTQRLVQPHVIMAWHDALLFTCAYPATEKLWQLAQTELERVAVAIADIYKEQHARKIYALNGSGMTHTELMCGFGFSLTKWLLQCFDTAVSLGDEEASKTEASEILHLLIPGIEFQSATQGNLGLIKRLQLLTGSNDRSFLLHWLIDRLNHSAVPLAVKEQWFERLKIYVRWKLDDKKYNRTFLREPAAPVFFHDEYLRSVNSVDELSKKLGKPLKLSSKEKQKVIDTARTSLAFYCRETDPFTYADANETTVFDMGRGLHIALIGMDHHKRLSLESYIGYMAFKNGVPVSYGGGWLFGSRCKVGVNIYPPFRGGESAWLFCQVLRVYHQYLGAKTFVVKPYQFGKDNAEGLRSGAFWFYYKLGFRPVDEKLNALAEKEWKKINGSKKYHSPIAVLKRFTACNLEWQLDAKHKAEPDAGMISDKITAIVSRQFFGDRHKAIEAASEILKLQAGLSAALFRKEEEKRTWQNWCLLLSLLPGIDRWPQRDKIAMFELLKLKANGAEADFVLAWQHHRSFWKSIQHWKK